MAKSDTVITKLSRTIASTCTLKLAEMHVVDVFYTPLEERFERITRLARRALNVPVAAITCLNGERQWFKSVAGWAVTELPATHSLCPLTVEGNRICVIPDTTADPRTIDHPLVIRRPHFRFYAGYPLQESSGMAVGTLCVFDTKPREFSEEQLCSLHDLGELARHELLTDQLSDAQSELISKLGAARREAMFDPLTRVWNRRGATALLRSALVKAKERDSEVSVCLLDVDNFKEINDSHGHQAGDQVLRKLAAMLVSSVRTDDIVCRYGGDEFLLILPDTDVKAAAGVAERARRTVADSPVQIRQGLARVSVSIGLAARHRGSDATLDDLIKQIDEALMACKREGRNRIRMAS
jgi:diguanylate cyclase (GGDEF)-like protein